MPAVFVDTSAFFAILDRDDLHHAPAARLWKRTLDSGAPLFTSNYVVVETCALLQRRNGMAAVRTLIEDILPLIGIEWVTEALHTAAILSALSANRKGLSVVDCVSFAMMRAQGAKYALAFDLHFREQGFTAPR